jgi:3-hydroxybutyryl-CoA dehydratase
MKSYKFKELKIGKSSSFKVKITEKLFSNFLLYSKDLSKIHVNRIFSKKYGFKDRVVHGMLIASFYSRFIGMNLPGKFSLLTNIEIKFNKPAYINDTITIKGEIDSLSSYYKVATIQIKAINQFKSTISSAKAIVKLNE